MKKSILLAFLYSFSQGIFAQNDTTAQNLQEVMVHENRIQIPFSKQSRNLTIVSKMQMETTPARSLQEVLSFVPGVDVRQRGVTGVQADVGIRGGSFDQTLMLLNGIKLTDPQSGHMMMNIPIPMVNIDRVEVLKGPASRIFGQNAYTGAINVITELSDSKYARIQGYAGDFGMKGINFAGSLPIGNYKQNLSFSHDDSNGHWYNSDYNVNNLFYEGGFDLGENQTLKGMIAYADRDFGANGFYSSTYPDQYESIQTTLASLSHTLDLEKFFLNTRTYWRKNADEYLLRRNEPEFYKNNHLSNVYALEANGNFETALGTTGFGVETRKEVLESTNLGDQERTLTGLFLEQFVNIGSKVDLRAGVYSNYYSQYGWKHFPGAELGLQASQNLRFYTGYGVSYRIPTYTDLYYVGPTNIGNDQLKPEQAQNFEVGAKWSKSGIHAELVYYNRHTDNLIDWVRPNEETPWQPQNFNEVTFNGIEASLNYRLSPSGQAIQVKEILFSYNYIDADQVQPSGAETRYALTALKNQLIGGMLIGIGKKTEWNTKARYVERMNQAHYFLLDMRADYNRTGKLGFFAEASNITNTEYVEAGTVQMPGRWFRAGFMLNFE